MKIFFLVLGAWVAVWSVVSVYYCIKDKRNAKIHPHHRVKESKLLALAMLGGSVAMYLCMLIIRHKTKHVKFMAGIPVIILAQTALIALTVLVILPKLGVTRG